MNNPGTSGFRTSACMTLAIGMLLAAAACADERPTEPMSRLESIVIESGDQQSAVTGETLPSPIVARALADDGSDYDGTVTVEVISGAGMISFGTATASGNGASIQTTPSGGRVEVTWTMGEPSVDQRLQFWALRAAGDTVAAFAEATATPASAISSTASGMRCGWFMGVPRVNGLTIVDRRTLTKTSQPL